MLSGQFYEKRLSVRERNMKLLLEKVTCIITIDTVMCIMHSRKYYLHNCDRDSICTITLKIVTHIFAAETLTCICAAET